MSGVTGHLQGFDLVQVGNTVEVRIIGGDAIADQVISLNFTTLGTLSAENFVF